MPEFKNREELEAWLKDQSRDVSVVIAARAALRVLPSLTIKWVRGEQESFAATQDIILPVFHASALAWVAAKYPTQDTAATTARAATTALATAKFYAADAAADAQVGFGTLASRGASAAAAAAYAVSYAAYAAAARTAAAAASAAADAAAAYADATYAYATGDPSLVSYPGGLSYDVDDAAATAVWQAISADATRIETDTTAPDELAGEALWDSEAPNWAVQKWTDLRRRLRELHPDWRVWTDWYEARLVGQLTYLDASPDQNEQLEFRRATIKNEIWDEGPAAVNTEIIRLENEILGAVWAEGPAAVNAEIRRLEIGLALQAVEQETAGNQWIEFGDQLVVDVAGTESDAEAAQGGQTQQLHEALRRKTREFANRGTSIEDEYGWTGFGDALSRFVDAVDTETEAIPDRIARVYDATVELASYLEFDADLRQRPLGNISSLDPDIRRALTNLIRTAAPWVRRFPSARDIDDEAGAFLARKELFEPAKAVLENAYAERLINDDDRVLIQSLLAAIKRNGLPAHKAGVRGLLSVKNLAVAAVSVIASIYVGGAGSDFASKSVLIPKAGDFVARNEQRILELLSDMPEDIQIYVQELIKDQRSQRNKDDRPGEPDKMPVTVTARVSRSEIGSEDRDDKDFWRVIFAATPQSPTPH